MASDIEGIQRIEGHISAVEQVYARLREAILSGQLQPGSRLPEGQLAAQLGVSRIPVREAMSRLVAEGLVRRLSYRGATVALPTVLEVAESYMLRALLEGFAAKLATPLLSATELARLKELIAKISQYARAGRVDELPSLHHEFHSTIYSRCGSAKLISWIEDLYTQLPRSRSHPLRVEEPVREYTAIVDALEAGDADLAGKLMSEHLDRGGEATANYYSELMSSQNQGA